MLGDPITLGCPHCGTGIVEIDAGQEDGDPQSCHNSGCAFAPVLRESPHPYLERA